MVADEWGNERWREHLRQQWQDEIAARDTSTGDTILPSMRGARVRIRPFEDDDVTQAHLWATDSYEQHLWRDEPGVMDIKQFREQLRQALAAGEPHLIVEGLNSGRTIGWVYADMVSPTDRRCRMHVYVIPEARCYGAGAEAGILFLDFLFDRLGMRKVFAETLLAQDDACAMAQHWGFEVEGLFREERWLGGQGHDVARLAIQRQRWERTNVAMPEHVAPDATPDARRMLQMQGRFFPSADAPQRL